MPGNIKNLFIFHPFVSSLVTICQAWHPSPPTRLLNSGPTVIINEVTSSSLQDGEYCLPSGDRNPIGKNPLQFQSILRTVPPEQQSLLCREVCGWSHLHLCYMPISLEAVQCNGASLNNINTHESTGMIKTSKTQKNCKLNLLL